MVDLAKSKLFSSLKPAELDALRQSAVQQNFPEGHTIFKEGDAGDGLYVVSSGLVLISAIVGQDERRVLSKVGPGDFFGEMAVLDDEPRSATATAREATTAIFIPREALLAMIEKSPGLAVNLVREFSLRMREFNRQYIRETLEAERLTLVGRFARSIVHDFKNPLNIIGLAAEFVNMDGLSPEIRASTSGKIQKQVDRLANMINELLEFTRGSGAPSALMPVEYKAYFEQLMEELRPEALEKGVEIVLRNDPPAVPVLMDGKRMLHVFTNLINNSMDAMVGGGTIYFRFAVTPDEVVTEIEDTGKGLAPEIMPRLFEAFATHGKMKGSGLGLSICKKIIEDHKGTINARNEPGKGAIFTFSLRSPASTSPH